MAIFFSCSQRYSPANDFQTEEVDDGTSVQIIGYSGRGGEVRIPPRIRGLPVTVIWDEAFMQKQLTGVVIPNSVTFIGEWTFAGNTITGVDIPESVTHIGEGAFAENRITNVTIPDSMTNIGAWAFERNRIATVTVPSHTEVHPQAFNRAVAITRR